MARGEAECFSIASRVLSQLPKCIHNSLDEQLKHGPFILDNCLFKRKLIKYRILLNHSERFDWLNSITRFVRHNNNNNVYRNLDSCSRHTKSARKFASHVLIHNNFPQLSKEKLFYKLDMFQRLVTHCRSTSCKKSLLVLSHLYGGKHKPN